MSKYAKPWPVKESYHPTRRADKWTWRQRRFMQWCALPKRKRPEGMRWQNDVAKELGVTISTLSRWKDLPGFWEGVHEEAHSIISTEVPNIMQAMVDEAIAGSVPAAKLCLQMVGLFDERVEHRTEVFEPLVLVMAESASGENRKRIEAVAGSDEEEEAEIVEGEYVHVGW